jgi:hypothetical protein
MAATTLKGDTQMTITIQTDADFTPKGKRTARVVELRGQMCKTRRIRWYVSGRIYHQLAVTDSNVSLTREWVSA